MVQHLALTQISEGFILSGHTRKRSMYSAIRSEACTADYGPIRDAPTESDAHLRIEMKGSCCVQPIPLLLLSLPFLVVQLSFFDRVRLEDRIP